ncbi:MAG TPA: tetratricopeptide repeat protein, partial [Candidatus Limnocylindria bacterium]|nr:tetratricopeptide repeat protein [Candidatus Limnocylindria bacterium]
GACFLDRHDFTQALACFQKALELRPHYGSSYFNLGRLYNAQKDYEKAWTCFKNCCIHADLDNEMGFTAYAEYSYLLQKYEDALIGFDKALACNPHNQNLQHCKAECQIKIQEQKNA